MRTFAVYTLSDEHGNVRYVGITKSPQERNKRHPREARYGNSHRKCWIRSMIKAGFQPKMTVIEWVEDWDEAERRWIAHFRAIGCDLVNGNDGGFTMNRPHLAEGYNLHIRHWFRLLDGHMNAKYSSPEAKEKAIALRQLLQSLVNHYRKQGRIKDLDDELARRELTFPDRAKRMKQTIAVM